MGEALVALAQATPKLSPCQVAAAPVLPAGLVGDEIGRWLERSCPTWPGSEPTRIAYGELTGFSAHRRPAIFQIAAEMAAYLACCGCRNGPFSWGQNGRHIKPAGRVRAAPVMAVEVGPVLFQVEVLLAENGKLPSTG
ncbi:MAG: hypothetical protein H6669_17620 [Ardenticatenaceae bacterium]|nr:hypothetical protein [Ardenticatenaceae bacterium]